MPPLSSPSVRFPFVPLSSGSGYSASCSSFQPSIGSASQWLSQRPDPFFRPDQIFLFLTDWFPIRSLRFCLFSFSVCSLSLFPASLPQPFHRCFGILRFLLLLFPIRPCVRSLRFHPASFPPQSFCFAPVRLGLRYLVSVSSFPCFKLPPHSGFHSAVPLSVPPRLLRFPSFGPPSASAFVSSGSLPQLHASLTLSGSFHASFSSFAPLPAVPFRFLWSVSLRIWYSVPLLFLSPLQVSPHSCYFLSPSHLLRFGPSPSLLSSPSFPPVPPFVHFTPVVSFLCSASSTLGSGYWAYRYTLKTEHRLFILQLYLKTSLSLRFGQAFGLLVSVSYTHYCASTSDLSTT